MKTITKYSLKALLLSVCFFSIPSHVNAKAVGQFSQYKDVGAVEYNGSTKFNKKSQIYTLKGSGKNMWAGEDEYQFAFNKIQGDFIVRARVRFEGEGVDLHRKAGWSVRQNLDADSPAVHAVIQGDGLTSLQFRQDKGGDTDQYLIKVNEADVVQLERRGDTYIMSAAKHGEAFKVTQVSNIKLGEELYVGLGLNSHNADVVETATFSNVRIIIPVADDFQPYKDYIGSNLEVMDMHTKSRRILHRSPDALEAPNWTHDGKMLIYNSKGLLFNFNLKNNKSSVLNTGFANQNNNDHVLSWNGKDIAISHHHVDDGLSTIYILPLTGSDNPKQVTKTGVGHSFLHGYSPDDKNLVFTANRKNKYDIYTINIDSGIETQMTDTAALDDGPEYSPDGKFIYFNSNRTGYMQLWKMNADGSNEEQLTFGEYNNWFPHLSPDGKKIVFLAYMDDVDSNDHPYYRHVYLKEMPVEGGEPKIIAYVYGGQGTINVPSWSPDGKHIAFVSNTWMEE